MQRVLCTLIILSLSISPFAHSGQPTSAATEAAEEASAKAACEVVLNPDAKYKPIGYVTGALVNQLTKTTPLLFTELYFRALGIALNKRGFSKMVNAKGVFLDEISSGDKDKVMSIIGGKSDASVQDQGEVATDIWNQMVKALRLNDELNTTDHQLDANKAYYKSVDDYIALHNYLSKNMLHKREAIELIRLSLPFGARMAANGLGGSIGKSVFVTSLVTVSTGLITYLVTKLAAMLGTPSAAGVFPYLLTAVSSAGSGYATFLYTAPKSYFPKLHVRLMNSANRKSLQKQGLIGEKDGESTGLIKAAFRDLGDLQNQVNVNDIVGVFPILPTSAKLQDVEKSMMKYGDKLGEQLTIVSAFQEQVALEMQKKARAMGQPIYSLARLLEFKNGDTAFAVTDNSHIAIREYADQVIKGHEMFSEVEAEYQALLDQYEVHFRVLESFNSQMASALDTRAKVLIERKLSDINVAKATIQTLLNVALTQKRTLEQDKQALDSAVTTIAAAAASKSLSATEADNLTKALSALAKNVKQAEESDIKDNEVLPTTEQGNAK